MSRSTIRGITQPVHAVVDKVVGVTGSMATGVATVLPGPVGAVVHLLHQVLDEIPTLDSELDVVAEAIHAQRLTAKSVAAQLTALDAQLGVLESAIAPLQQWGHRWRGVRVTIENLLVELEAAATRPPDPS